MQGCLAMLECIYQQFLANLTIQIGKPIYSHYHNGIIMGYDDMIIIIMGLIY